MATPRETDQDRASAVTDDVTESPVSQQSAITDARRYVASTVPAYQGVCDVTVDKGLSKYVATPALEEADILLQEKGWVILCGPPGCGKTTLAYALSRRNRDQGFSPYVLEHLEQLKPEVGKSERSVVVLDGILGEVRVNSQQRGCWKSTLDTILMLRKHRACRFVITVYPHVLRELQQLEKERKSPLLDRGAVVWLTHTLPEDVKAKILKFHLDKLQLETDRQNQVVEKILQNGFDASGPVFPWCCSYMIELWGVSHDPTAIFQAPAKAYAELFKEMVLDHTHGGAFAALFSLTMKGLSYFLHDPFKTETRLKELGLEPFPPDKLAAYAHFLQGSILSEGTFSDRVLYEAAGLALGLYFRFPVLVAVCDTPFLVQYVGIEAINRGVAGDLIGVTVGSVSSRPRDTKQYSEDIQSLVKRVYTEIIQGNLQQICQHPCLQCPQFLQELVNYCAGNSKMIKELLVAVDSEHHLPLGYWSVFLPSHHLTDLCISMVKADKLSYRIRMVRSLFDNITQNPERRRHSFPHQRFDWLKCTMEFPILGKDQCLRTEIQKQIEIITETGSALYLLDPSLPIPPDIVTLHISNKLRIQVEDRRFWYLVYRLLTDREVNETDQDGNSLLHIAVSCRLLSAVRLCLKAGAAMTLKNRKNLTPYQMAKKPGSRLSKSRKPMSTDQIFRCLPGLDITEMQCLLLQDLSVNDKDADGSTGLHMACREGRGDIADLFIDLGADVNAKDKGLGMHRCVYIDSMRLCIRDHCTPLHYACENGVTHTVRRLIQHQADVAAATRRGYKALHFACLCSSHTASADIACLLVQAGADVNSQLREGIAPLHLAALRGHSDTARLLADHGADVNAPDKQGCTPLHLAAREGHTDTVEVLIRHEADINLQNKEADTPFHCAVLKNHLDTAQLLASNGVDINIQSEDGATLLHFVAHEGCSQLAELLIRQGVDVNTQDKKSWTPLHLAAQDGHLETLRLLLSHDADVNSQGTEGFTPLHLAACEGHSDSAKLLICHRAGVNLQDKEGNTPLHVAAYKGHFDTAELLMGHGADVNSQNKEGRTLLHFTADQGRTDTAELLIHRDADVNVRDHKGHTPLHAAAYNGHVDTGKLLIRLGADVNIENNEESTPLHCAAHEGHSHTAELLICHGADVNVQTKEGWTPIHLAVREGHLETAEELIYLGFDAITRHQERWTSLWAIVEGQSNISKPVIINSANTMAQNTAKHTLLHWASRKGHSDTAELLIHHGADVNAQNEQGDTPLHWATQKGHKDTAELLIREGADINAQSKRENTPLHCAAEKGHRDIAELLIRHGADVNAHNKEGTSLHSAVKGGHTDTAELLIRHDADVNTQSKEGNTPLHCAADKGHTDTAEVLIRHGADVSTHEICGWTPLHWAAQEGHKVMSELLIRHSADVNARDKDGWTPLHWAVQEGRTDMAELLIRHGAHVNAQSNRGHTPLHWAADNGHTDTAELLIRHDADISLQDEYGWTVLHWAAFDHHTNSAELLIRHGAEVNVQSKGGSTPLHFAAKEGRTNTAELLIHHGAEVNVQNKKGNTPLEFAALGGNTNTPKFLIRPGASVNSLTKRIKTPLQCAIHRGHKDTAALLIHHGAHV